MNKKIIAGAALLGLFSISSFADKVVINGEPVMLQEKEGIYHYPGTYNVTTPYNYVTLDNTRNICYAEAQPTLTSINSKVVAVELGGKQVQWTCYEYSDDYFTVSP